MASQQSAELGAVALASALAVNNGFNGLLMEDSDVLIPMTTKHYTVVLQRGVTYALFAAGDESIHDLDIQLYDENGFMVGRDEAVDNTPLVLVTPRWSGPFELRISNISGGGGWYHTAILY